MAATPRFIVTTTREGETVTVFDDGSYCLGWIPRSDAELAEMDRRLAPCA